MLEFVQSKCLLSHLLLGGVVSMELTSDVKQHHHNYVEIFIIISGSAVHVVNGKREGCYPGYVSVINVGCNHGFEKVNNLNVINLSCTPDLFERLNFNFALLNGKEMVFQGNKLYSTIKFKGMLFYEIKAEGKRIQIMGSMGMDPETDYPEGADLLIMALQGRADQDDYAMQFVKKLKPKEIMLYHIDDSFPPMSSEVDTLGFEINAKKAGYTSFKPEKNREYEI
jgi:hypothetical protein